MTAVGAEIQTPWFESPFFEEELERSALDAEMKQNVAAFARNGYLVFDPGISDFDRLAEELVRALAPEHERVGNRVADAWRYVPAVRTLASAPAILEMLEALYRSRPIPFQTLNFQRGTEQATHSDVVHFNSLPPRFMAGVWVALEDVGPENGPLHYYPGSHRLPVYEPHDLGLTATVRDRNRNAQLYVAFLRKLVEHSGLHRETLSIRRGQAMIWTANLLHGGDPIADPNSTRLSQVTHYYFEGCRYYTPLYSNPPLGQYDWSRVIDVSTGEDQPHFYNGRRVRLPLRVRARYAIQDRLWGSRVGRDLFRRVRGILIRS